MKNFIELVQARSSVRKFKDTPVDRELLTQCVQAAHLAPSAENVQPWRYVIVDDPKIKQQLAAQAFSGIFGATRWAAQAPVLVVLAAELDVLANRIGKQVTGISYYLIDTGISGEHFVLQAAELGLGTCWIGWFNNKAVKRVLQLPRTWRPVSLFAVGWPQNQKQSFHKRKPLESILFFNKAR